jgi:hypothetical protein
MRLGSLNPPLTVDARHDVWHPDEDRGLRRLYRVIVASTDGNATNGGEVLEYAADGVRSKDAPLARTEGRIHASGGKLLEVAGDRTSVISKQVENIHFTVPPGDPHALLVEMTVKLPATSVQGRGNAMTQRIVLRPDADSVVFQMRSEVF